MLEEMRGSVGLVGFESAACVDPDAGGSSGGGECGLRRYAESVRQRCHTGFWRGQNLGVVSNGGMGRGEAQETRIGVVEALDLGSDGLREAVVDHDRRGVGDGDGIGRGGKG